MAAHQEKNIVSVVLIVIALGFLYLCYNFQSQLVESGDMTMFVGAVVVAASLMFFLLYLVSNRVDKRPAKKSSSKRKK